MKGEPVLEAVQGGSPRLRRPLSRSGGSLNSLAPLGTSEWDEDEDYEPFEDIVEVKVRKLVEAEIKSRVRRFLARQRTAKRTLVRDKVTFMAGTLDLWLSAYWLGAWPESFYKLYTVKAAVLFALRWVVYRYKRWHYYLLDLCYAAQVILLVQLWAFPLSIRFIKISFALNCGPLLWSIIAFRNSLVYHSLDKLTSHFLHWFPACVSWATRWYPSEALRAHIASSPELTAEWEASNLRELMLLPLGPYLLWAVAYYLKVFVISSDRITQRGYTTLYNYVTSSRSGLFGSVVLRFPTRVQPAVYMCMHIALCAATLLFNALWWRSQLACTLFLLAIFMASAWSGASFYFDVFSRRYISELETRAQSDGGRGARPPLRTATPGPAAAAASVSAPVSPHVRTASGILAAAIVAEGVRGDSPPPRTESGHTSATEGADLLDLGEIALGVGQDDLLARAGEPLDGINEDRPKDA